MSGAVAERRRADFDIPAPLPLVCSHICGAHAGGSAISLGQRWFGVRGFEGDAENWVLGPFVAELILLPLRLRFATAYMWMHVMICVEANFSPVSVPIENSSKATFCGIALRWMPQNLTQREVIIGSANGLILSGTKPLPDSMLTQIYVTWYDITRP